MCNLALFLFLLLRKGTETYIKIFNEALSVSEGITNGTFFMV